MSASRAADRLFTSSCEFMRGAATLEDLPPAGPPEIAFIGRSNVGKSSLINALTGRKALARVSVTPGRTQQLNFFALGEALVLVDLPGYGFAKAPRALVKEWNELVRGYLRGRPNLRRTCVLVDSRRGVMENDETMMSMLDDAAVTYQLVLTKADKITTTAAQHVLESARAAVARRPAAHPDVVLTSAQEREGIAPLREALAMLAIHP